MPGVIATLPKFQFSNALGLPMAGGTITSYLAGTTTLAATYQDEALSAANTNPIALDSRGECTLWLDSTKTYKFVLKNALGVVQWTVDSITNSAAFAKAYADSLDTALRADLSASSGSTLVGHLPVGAGAVAKDVSKKLQENVSVMDFGANPAASGAVNRAAFVFAMAASKSVYVPLGTYAISGTTIVIPDGVRLYGAGTYATVINFTPSSDVDCFQIGWYTALEEMTINNLHSGAGSNGTLRLQSLTNSEIPTNVGGNNWKASEVGGLSYKNTLKNLVISGGQNYNIYAVNIAYTTFQNVRAVLSRNSSGNVYIFGKGGINMPISTTLTIIDCEFTASFAGPGFSATNLAQSLMVNMKCEGNHGRGVLLNNCQQIKLQTPYVENNFALGAVKGDGDIVCVGCTQISISDGYVLANNSFYAINASGSKSCSLSSTGYYLLGGATAMLNLDSGWYYSNSAFGVLDTGVQSDGRWARYVDGTVIFTKTVTWTGDINAASGGLFVEPLGVADVDFPNVFMSDGASGYEMQAAFHVMSDSANFVWVVSSGAARVNNAIRYRLASPTSKTGITVDIQITLTGRWK